MKLHFLFLYVVFACFQTQAQNKTRFEIAPVDAKKYSDFQELTQVIKGGVVQVSPDGLFSEVAASIKESYTSDMAFMDGTSKLSLSPIPEDTRNILNLIQDWIKNSNDSHGTGFFIAENLILTNAHVVKSAIGVKIYPSAVTLEQDKKNWVSGKVIWRTWANSTEYGNMGIDLALIKLDDKAVSQVQEILSKNNISKYVFKASPKTNLMAGEAAATYSNPAYQQGYLSVGSIVDSVTKFSDQPRVVDLTNATNGSSGGPVFDLSGNIIGVIYAMANPEANLGLRSMFYIPIHLVLDLVNSENLPISNLGLGWFFNHFKVLNKTAEEYALQTIVSPPPEFSVGKERNYGFIVSYLPKSLQKEDGLKVNDLVYAIDGLRLKVEKVTSSPRNPNIYLVETQKGTYSLAYYFLMNEQKDSFELSVYRNGESDVLKVIIPNAAKEYSLKATSIINSVNNFNKWAPYTEINGFSFMDVKDANSTFYSWISQALSFVQIPEEGVIFAGVNYTLLSKNQILAEKNRSFVDLFFFIKRNYSLGSTEENQKMVNDFKSVLMTYNLNQMLKPGIIRVASVNSVEVKNIQDFNFEIQKSKDAGLAVVMLELEIYQSGNSGSMDIIVERSSLAFFIGADDNDANSEVLDQLLGGN